MRITENTPSDLYRIAERLPSMGGTALGPLLRGLAANASAQTSIVEVGCWLGAGTAQLALGIRERQLPGPVSLHCYDRWEANEPEVEKATKAGVSLAPGDDLMPLVKRTLAPFGVPIQFHKGDIRHARWDGGPISVKSKPPAAPASFSA